MSTGFCKSERHRRLQSIDPVLLQQIWLVLHEYPVWQSESRAQRPPAPTACWGMANSGREQPGPPMQIATMNANHMSKRLYSLW
jgi:hypothetical protein